MSTDGSENGDAAQDDALELLYDPASDDRDAKWVGEIRRGRHSDAILSCPCCFTTLCVDCQQHVSQPTLYRAMFVMNCEVRRNPSRAPETPPGKRTRPEETKEENGAVFCRQCDCEVGIYDEEGVYHFFNTLPSTA